MQQIRRDGNITLPLIGEFKAAGLAPSQAEKELLRLYNPHLQVKEVTVTMESSAFAVYVTGAVQRPGKIMSDRPISALEAVVEAGVDHTKANLKKVRVVRQVNGRTGYLHPQFERRPPGKQAHRVVRLETIRHHLRAGTVLPFLAKSDGYRTVSPMDADSCRWRPIRDIGLFRISLGFTSS